MDDAGVCVDCDEPDASGGDAGLCARCEQTDFLNVLADPLAPAKKLPGKAYLRSSRYVEAPEGMGNRDHSHYLRTEGGRAVLLEETGPGVITRMWFTFGPDSALGDQARLHVFIDGSEIEFVEGQSGITLGNLTAGGLAGLSPPWVLGRAFASGGFVIAVPIHYSEGARIELESESMWTYYQIDGRALPPESIIESYTYPPNTTALDALRSANAIWEHHEHPGTNIDSGPLELEPGAMYEQMFVGPGALTTLEVFAPREIRRDLRVRIESDGELSVDAPLSWMTGSASPAGEEYESSFTAADTQSARFYYPVPYTTNARVQFINERAEAVSARISIRSITTSIDESVGRLRADCRETVIDIPMTVCETDPVGLSYPNTVVGQFAGKGQYAGHTLFQHAPVCWWFALEPDHEIAIDGSYEILGTGTEDYYAGAFYFMNGPYASVMAGATGWERRADGSADTHLYRHHIFDTIPFQEEFRFEFESYVDGTRFEGCMFAYVF